MANEPRNLYENLDFFRLLIDGVWKYIDEPIGWDKVNIKFDRDKDYYGLNYEFADEKTTLLFLMKEGGDELKMIYERDGSDGKVVYEYGYYQGSDLKVQFTGDVNFNDKNETDEGMVFSIQKTFFQSLLRTRYETKVSLNATETLDGVPMTPLVPLSLKMHSKKLIKLGKAIQERDPYSDSGVILAHPICYFQPDTTRIEKAEVEELQSMPLGISNVTAQSELRYQFVSKESGLIKCKWTLSHQVEIAPKGIFSSQINDWSMTPIIQIFRSGVLVQSFAPVFARIQGHVDSKYLTVNHSFTIEQYFSVLVNDEIYFNINAVTDNNDENRRWVLRSHVNSIEIEQQTVAESSFCNVYKLFDILNFVVEAITGRQNAVISSFIGVGGCAEKFSITNGFQLRNFLVAEKPVQVSMKDLLEGASPIWCLGIQYSLALGLDVIRIEPAKRFFGTKSMLELKAKDIDFESWDDSHSKDFVFNEAEVGYLKFAENELNTLDDANTYSEWLTPISTYKAKYSKKSSFISSGYLIEILRREQFKENPSTSLSDDNSLFIVSYITERKHYSVSYETSGISITLGKPVNMQTGDTFTFVKDGGGGANDATLFTVLSKDISGIEKYSISPAPVADFGLALVQIVILTPEAEKNEPFEKVEGILSPETSYNLRITPKRNLYNHSEILNSCLEKKLGAAEIKNTFVKNNGELITKFSDQEPCKLTDDNLELKENEAIVLDNFNTRRQIFKPEVVTFKVKMRYDQVVYMKERLRGETRTIEDYAFISHPDISGNMWESYVWALNYEPDSEICTITVRKRRKII